LARRGAGGFLIASTSVARPPDGVARPPSPDLPTVSPDLRR